MEFEISFDEENKNLILIHQGRLKNIIACPPIEYGCDILNFSDKLVDGYNYNFDGLVLITNPKQREIYYKGKLIAKTER